MYERGRVAERLNALVSKTSIHLGVSRVRIPPCPLIRTNLNEISTFFIWIDRKNLYIGSIFNEERKR